MLFYLISLGYIPQACKACTHSVSGLKREPRVSNRDISGLMKELIHLKQSPEVTTQHIWWIRSRTWKQPSPPGGRGKLSVMWGTDIRLAHWLPGKLAEGYGPHHLFGKLSWWRRSDPKIRANTSWSRSQVCRELCKVSLGEAGPGGAGEV